MYRCEWCGSVYRCDKGICGKCPLVCPEVEVIKNEGYCHFCEQWREELEEIENRINSYQKGKNLVQKIKKLVKKETIDDL